MKQLRKINKNLFILLIIFALSLSLRFVYLTKFPVSLSIDEVAVGYNAFSILKTGQDEYGIRLPLAFRSVGDYKPPVLIYFLVPAIAIFGLNEFGVRFPIALIGALTVFPVYWLVKQLTKKRSVALITCFSLAISPWHIFFSRASFEAILALFLFILGIGFFYYSLNKKSYFLILAAVIWVISAYTYHAQRIFIPVFCFGMFFIYWEDLKKQKRILKLSVLVALLLALPLLKMMLGPAGQTRARMTFISNDENIAYQLHQPSEKLTLRERIFDNNFLILGNFWIKRYFNYWDPTFLFFKGMKLTLPGVMDIGLFHLFELPFFLFGLWLFFFRKAVANQKNRKLIILWLLVGPLAASLANNDQHPLRSLTIIPAPQILIALGGNFILEKLNKLNLLKKIPLYIFFSLIVSLSLLYWTDLYFVHYPIQFSEYWDYGLKEAANFAWEHYNEYKQIIVDNVFGAQGPYIVGTPHLYLLFFGKYDPVVLHQERRSNLENFGKFIFRTIYWPKDRELEKTLFIGSPWRLPLKDINDNQIVKKIYFKNGQLGFLIVKT